jgi:hypothetical protein
MERGIVENIEEARSEKWYVTGVDIRRTLEN